MFATTARRSTAFLLYAALQFVVLTFIAMRLYPDYRFDGHMFSHLGVTRTWEGQSNYASFGVFLFAVVVLGAALIGFAAAWRDYAFDLGRGRRTGIASQIFGTLSGLCFIGVGLAPMDRVLDLHNALVVIAFGFLLACSACMTVVWWRNGGPRSVLVGGGLYAALLVAFFAVSIWVVTTDLWKHFRILIIAQKIAIYASMSYVVFLTLTIRRRLR
jgi:hypothetical protein